MAAMKIETVNIPEDAKVEGYGIFYAGDYRVEMPEDYEPEFVTADDIVCDWALRVVPDWMED